MKATRYNLIGIAKAGLRRELLEREVYLRLARNFQKHALAEKLKHFSEVEREHASFWIYFLKNRNVNPDAVKPSTLEAKLIAFLCRIIGLGLTLKLLENGERIAINLFSAASKSDLLSEEESKKINVFLKEELAHEEEFGRAFLNYETRFKIFIDKIGIIFSQTNDGLVLVISTALGLAGIYSNAFLIGLAGLTVAIASSLATTVSSYFFVRTENGLKHDILERLRLSSSCAPEIYQLRIEKYMKQKNYDEDVARNIAAQAKEKNMIDRIIAEEEYGILTNEIGDPAKNAVQAGVFKIVGTILPLLPFLLGFSVSISIPVSIIITLALLSIVGAVSGVAAQIPVKKKVLELTTAGFIVSMAAFLLGRLAAVLSAMV